MWFNYKDLLCRLIGIPGALYRFFHGRFEETLGLGADASGEP